MSPVSPQGHEPGSFQALGAYVDRRLEALREGARRGAGAVRDLAASVRQSAVGFRLEEWLAAAWARAMVAAPTMRERIHAIVAVLLCGFLVVADIQGRGRDESVGMAFLAVVIGYAIFANVRNRAWRTRKLTTWGLVLFCLGLYMANGFFASALGAYGAIVATIFMTAAYLWSLRERKVAPNQFRRLLVAFLLSLLPLGWMAYDYWHVLGEQAKQAEEEISENLRVRMKPVLAKLEREFGAATGGLLRVRKPGEPVIDRVTDMSRSQAVSLAFYLPEGSGGHAMFARRGEVVPQSALGLGFERLIENAAAKLRGRTGINEMLIQSARGNGFLLVLGVPRDGHYGVILSQRYLLEEVCERALKQDRLDEKVRVVTAYKPARTDAEGEIVLIGSQQMPQHWTFAKVLVEPEAFAKAKAAVDSRKLIAQVWFAVLVVWLGAAFVNMYRTATRDMALADMKSNFVSSVTHELKTPLGMIRMYSEMLQLGLVGEGKKSEDYLHIITAEADRLARLIDNVLDFSKIQKGTKTYDFADVDLREVAVAAIRSLEGAFDSSGKDVDFEAPESIVVRADRDAALQATINLLSNAVKYGGSHIKVSLAKVGAEVHLDVRDDGPGIPLAEQKNVFLPFYRMGREEERTAPGTGLGLALVNEIMRAHHGSVRLNSQPGLGAVFTLAFPAPAPAGTEEETHAA